MDSEPQESSSRPQWGTRPSRGRSPPRDVRFKRSNSPPHRGRGRGRGGMSRFDTAVSHQQKVNAPPLEEQMKAYFESIQELLKEPIFTNPEPQPEPEPQFTRGRGRGHGRANNSGWQRN